MAFDKEKQTAMETALRNTAAAVTGEKARSSGLNIASKASKCVDAAEQLKQGIYEVMMLGAFSTGKSTVINALLGKSVLPESVNPCTAIITHLQYSVERNGTVDVYLKDGGVVQYSYDDFKVNYKYTEKDEKEFKAKGIVERFAAVNYAVVYSNLGILTNGVQVVDTPGLKNNSQDNLISLAEAQKANAIIFLLSSDRAFDEDEKEYIKSNFAGKNLKNVFFLITKFDNQKREVQQNEVRQRARMELEKVFTSSDGRFNEDLYSKRVFFISAMNTLISREEKTCPEDVSFSNFEKEIEIFLKNDEKAHQVYKDDVAKIAVLYKETKKYEKNLRDVYQSTDSDFANKIQSVLSDIEDVKGRIETLKSLFTTTRNSVNTIISEETNLWISDLKKGWEAKKQELNETTDFGSVDVVNMTGQRIWGGIRNIAQWVATRFNGEDYESISKQIDKETTEKIVAIIQPLLDNILEYIRERYATALNRINERGDKQISELNKGIGEIKVKLDKLSGSYNELDTDGGFKFDGDNIKSIIALLLGDYSQFLTLPNENIGWGEFAARFVKQFAVDLVAAGIFGPIGFFVAEFVQLAIGAGNVQEQFYEKAFAKITENLESENERMILKLQSQFSRNFIKEQEKTLTSLNAELSQMEDRWHFLENEKNNESSSFGVKINTVNDIANKIEVEVKTALSGSLTEIVSFDDFKKML